MTYIINHSRTNCQRQSLVQLGCDEAAHHIEAVAVVLHGDDFTRGDTANSEDFIKLTSSVPLFYQNFDIVPLWLSHFNHNACMYT